MSESADTASVQGISLRQLEEPLVIDYANVTIPARFLRELLQLLPLH